MKSELKWNNKYPQLQLDSFMPFGKYKGQLVNRIALKHKNYLKWLCQQNPKLFSPSAKKIIQSLL